MDIYQKITDRIVKILEQGTELPWHQPWRSMGGSNPVNAVTGRPYRGINVLMLWSEQLDRGFTSSRWLTYRQARQVGGHVRKGESGTLIVFWRFVEKPELDEDGQAVLDDEGRPLKRIIPFARGYRVFNVEQCEDLPDEVRGMTEAPEQSWDRIDEAELVVRRTGADIRHGGDQAFYAPTRDYIAMPDPRQFDDLEAYYGTLFHELTHWTGHPSRLARNFGRFGDQAYAFEELVAEIGAAFVCARLGIQTRFREDHAAYIAGWLKVLKKDRKAIFTAASQAGKAADLILGTGEDRIPEADPEDSVCLEPALDATA